MCPTGLQQLVLHLPRTWLQMDLMFSTNKLWSHWSRRDRGQTIEAAHSSNQTPLQRHFGRWEWKWPITNLIFAQLFIDLVSAIVCWYVKWTVTSRKQRKRGDACQDIELPNKHTLYYKSPLTLVCLWQSSHAHKCGAPWPCQVFFVLIVTENQRLRELFFWT